MLTKSWAQQHGDCSWSPVSFTVTSLHLHRIPLHKGKSLRNNLKERGLLEDFLRRYQYEFIEKDSNIGVVASEPLTNYLDVSLCRPSQSEISCPQASALPESSLFQ